MLKTIIASIVLLSLFQVTVAQCDKKYKLVVDRVVSINADSTDGAELPFTVGVVILKDSIRITITTPEGDANIDGKHTDIVCKMNADYTEGYIEYKTDAQMLRGSETRDVKMNFRLEAKAGVLKLFGAPDTEPNERICFYIKEKQPVQ